MSARPTKVYLVGEGPTELGDLAKEEMYRDDPPADGYAQALLRVIAGEDCPLEFEGRRVSLLGRTRVTEPRDALGKKARFALALAGDEGARALVLIHDLDREPGTKLSAREASRRRAEMQAAIAGGFDAARTTNGALGAITTLVGLPERMIEAWILGDPDALEAHGLNADEARTITPEDTWGDEQIPASKHPKRVLQRTSDGPLHNGDYAEVATHTNPDSLAKRCPRSFAPFLEAARAALAKCRAEKQTERRPKGKKG
jgi:hypothetical protein